MSKKLFNFFGYLMLYTVKVPFFTSLKSYNKYLALYIYILHYLCIAMTKNKLHIIPYLCLKKEVL
jgi:hypothetical protein